MPHDRHYGLAAQELAEQRPDRDLFAKAYALALGDAQKTKAIYIRERAPRLELEERKSAEKSEQEARRFAAKTAEIEKARLSQEKAAKESAAKFEKERLAREREAAKMKELRRPRDWMGNPL